MIKTSLVLHSCNLHNRAKPSEHQGKAHINQAWYKACWWLHWMLWVGESCSLGVHWMGQGRAVRATTYCYTELRPEDAGSKQK